MMPRIYKHGSTSKIAYFRFIGALSNIILNILLIPKFGIMGSAFATLISFALMSYYIFNFGNRLEYIKYNIKGWVFPCLAWIMVIILIILENNYLMGMLVLLLYPFAWYKLIITNTEREKIVEMIQ